MNYPPPPPQSSPAALSRFRASSGAAAYHHPPPGLDLRGPTSAQQYRTLPSQVTQQQQHGNAATATPRSYASYTTTGFQSAPLAAPSDFNLPRTPADLASSSAHANANAPAPRDYHMPQLSAPMAPPGDFGAYSTRDRYEQDTEMPQRHSQSPQYLRSDDYASQQHRRKRSYTMPGSFGTP